MNITSEFFNFNMWELFLHSSVLEQIEHDLSKINWLCGVILLHSNSIGALRQVFIVSHSYQTYFSFPGSDLNLDYGLWYDPGNEKTINSDSDVKYTTIQFHGNSYNSQSNCWIRLKFYVESPDRLSYLGLKFQVNKSLGRHHNIGQ
jgi:hypothetical protein